MRETESQKNFFFVVLVAIVVFAGIVVGGLVSGKSLEQIFNPIQIVANN